ncbi:MAG TPA: DUF6268 family outer membrane beta-barrel protein, partial [Cytophagaceae bacterium]|nr:DUF6268 family outer membrane beta-barrel protein [Cytophagaceae bacterium]
TLRFTGGLVFNRTVSERFSYRIGFERNYLFGRRMQLPVIGFRIGRLDKLNLVVQFPRNISLNFPIGKRIYMSFYTSPNGGVYTINAIPGLFPHDNRSIIFTRNEITSGFQFNFRASNHFSFFISSGIVRNRRISFLDREKAVGSNKEDINKLVMQSSFLSFGINISFGRAKQVYNNHVLYDAFNMNNIYTPGSPQNQNIPSNPEKSKAESINRIKYKDIEDLVTEE